MSAIVPDYVVEAAGWMLIHSLWQSAVVAIGASLLLKVSGSRSARVNYAVYCAGLLTCVCWAAWTFAGNARLPKRASIVHAPPAALDGATSGDEPASDPTVTRAENASVRAAPRVIPAIVALWCIGVTGMTLRGCMASLWVRRMRREARPWNDSAWQARFDQWLVELGITRRARLCLSTLSEVPAVVGHLKPMILLPCSLVTQLTPAQLEAVILHELMHIRRNDYLVNLLQVACETLFFFNPAIWWLSRSIRVEREHCCDEAAAQTKGDRLEYAKALLRVEELRVRAVPALALAATHGSLRDRVGRLLGTDQARYGFPGWTGAALLAGLALVLVNYGVPGMAAKENASQFLQLRSVVPPGTAGAEALSFTRKTIEGKDFSQDIALAKETLLDASSVAEAQVENDALSRQPQIRVRLTPDGAKRFGEITKAHVGRQIAILVDGQIMSAPFVNEPIPGGSFVISGNFSEEEAKKLADRLNAGGAKGQEATGAEADQVATSRVAARHDTAYLAKTYAALKAIAEKPDGRRELRQIMPTVHPDAALERLLEELSKMQRTLAGAKADLSEQHPEVAKLRAIIRVLEEQIDERVDGILRGLAVKAQSASAVDEKKADDERSAIRAAFEGRRPSELLEEARLLRETGRYQEALDRHVWYHTASRNERGQGGVRLSFALSDWLALGQAYPPALQKLIEVRDETGEALKHADMSVDPFTLFSEYAAMSETLRENEKTIDLFRWLDANDPDLARRVYLAAQRPLLRAGETELAAKYVEPKHFESLLHSLLAEKSRPDTRKPMLPQLEKMFRERTATLVALLVTRGDKDTAERIAQRALEAVSDREFKRTLEAALKGEMAK